MTEKKNDSYEEKCGILAGRMREYAGQNLVVAFSGGVDSSLLLKLAACYGKATVYGVTVMTTLHPAADEEAAARTAAEIGARHVVLKVDELEKAGITDNPVDRCYRCKRYLFGQVMEFADSVQAPVVVDGTNADDLLSYRPGIRALEELGVKSPLREAGMTKAEVRRLASEYGLTAASRPSAPCLATRFPYGTGLTGEKLKAVEAGETYLKTLGGYNVRLRVHGDIARIEVDEGSMGGILDHRREICHVLKGLGYAYITLDLQGFRSGSMDEKLLAGGLKGE